MLRQTDALLGDKAAPELIDGCSSRFEEMTAASEEAAEAANFDGQALAALISAKVLTAA